MNALHDVASPRRRVFDGDTKALCILQEDDDFVDMVRIFLEHTGLKVNITKNGQEGLNRLRHERPNVVILDERTSGMDGFKVYMVMKQDVMLRHVPLVFISHGILGEFPGVRHTKDIVTLPFNFDEFVEAIHWVIDAKTREAEAPLH